MTLTDRDSTTIHILRFSFNDDHPVSVSSLLSSTVSSEPLLEQRLLTLSSTLVLRHCHCPHSSLIFLSTFPKVFSVVVQRFLQLVSFVVSSRILRRDHCVLDTPCFGSIRWVSRNFSPLRSSVSVYSNTPQIHIYTR